MPRRPPCRSTYSSKGKWTGVFSVMFTLDFSVYSGVLSKPQRFRPLLMQGGISAVLSVKCLDWSVCARARVNKSWSIIKTIWAVAFYNSFFCYCTLFAVIFDLYKLWNRYRYEIGIKKYILIIIYKLSKVLLYNLWKGCYLEIPSKCVVALLGKKISIILYAW